jgi:hypothetical protein
LAGIEIGGAMHNITQEEYDALVVEEVVVTYD